MRRAIFVAVLCLIAAVPATASASFHLIKISEVGNANPADYVELQMYAPGENFVADHYIRFYNGTGAVLETFHFPANVAQGGNQRTILSAATWRSHGRPSRTSGRRRSWSTPTARPVIWTRCCFPDRLRVLRHVRQHAVAADRDAGVRDPRRRRGGHLQRSIASGCATLLELSDDTGDSPPTSTSPPRPRATTRPRRPRRPATPARRKRRSRRSRESVRASGGRSSPSGRASPGRPSSASSTGAGSCPVSRRCASGSGVASTGSRSSQSTGKATAIIPPRRPGSSACAGADPAANRLR